MDKDINILIVDDFATMRSIIRNLLRDLGFNNTAEAKREQIVIAAEAGVNGYVVKPFTAATLKDKIEKIFQRPQP